LLYNGILGDRRPAGGNVLTGAVLDALKALLPDHAGPWIVFGESCRLSPRRLAAAGHALQADSLRDQGALTMSLLTSQALPDRGA
jgi:hypothetical protein